MADCYTGEIRTFAGKFVPMGWQACDGTLLPVNDYQALFSLIGTTYGGDGRTNFAVPDLRGRLPIHFGAGPGLTVHAFGSKGGSETVTLTTAQLPVHSHSFQASSLNATSTNPSGNTLATVAAPWTQYVPSTDQVQLNPMAPASVAAAGGGQPHPNLMPSLVVTYIIALNGLFPQQS